MEQNDAPPNAFSAAAANTHHGWSADQEEVLAAVQNTCMNSAEKHRVQYFHLQSFLKYFRVPSIILSAVTSVVSVGLQLYVPQETISLVTCLLSLFVGILNSLELYLQIQASMESELMSYKDYYMLANEISKTLVLHPQHRTMDGSAYIEDKFSIFMKLMENAKPLRNRTRDPFRTLDLQLGSGASVIINGAQYHPRRAPSTAFLRTGAGEAGGPGGAAGEREHAYLAVAATTPRRPTQTDRSSSDNQTLSSEEAALPAPHHSLAYAARPDHLLMRHHSGSHPPTPRAAPSSAASLLATAEEGRFRHAVGDDPREQEEEVVLFNEARDQIRATLEQQHLHQYQHHHQTTSSDDSSSRHMIHPVGSSVDESDGNWFGNAAHRLFGSAVSTPSSRSLGAPPPSRAGYFTPSVPSMSPAAAAAAGRRTRPRPPSLVVASSARRDDTDSSASSNEPPRQPYRRASPSATAATAVPVVAGGAFKPQLSPVIEGTQSSFVRPAPIQVAPPPPPPPPPMDRGITPEAVRKGLAVTPSRRGDGAKEKQDEEEEEKESIIT